MSFNFGNKAGTGTTQSSGFSFGNTGGGGFSFSAKTTSQTAASLLSTPQSGGFSFGNTATTGPQQTSQSSGFSFGSTTSSQVPKPNFSFTTPASTTKSGFGFGSTTSASSAGGFGFGSSTTSASQSSGFGFGNATTASSNAPAFSSDITASKPSGGFSFGGAATTATGFSFASQTTSATKAPAFGFNATPATISQTQSKGLNFGSSLQQPTQSEGNTLNQAGSATTSLFSSNKNTTSNPPAFGSSLIGLLKTTAATSLSSTATKSDAGGFQLNTTSTSAGGSAFSLPSFKPVATTGAASTGFQLPTTSSTGLFLSSSGTPASTGALAPSAGRYSLHQPAESAPTGKPDGVPPGQSTSSAVPQSQSIIPTATSASQTSGFKPSFQFSSTSTPATFASAPAPAPTTTSTGLSTGFKLPSSTTTSSALPSALAPASTSTAATTVSAPTLKYKELETKINKWKGDLEQQEQLFITQATQVNAWSRLLVSNAEKITALNDEFEKVTCDQERLNQELDFINTQQDELENLLTPLEEATQKQINSMTSSVHAHHADVERERTYNLAETIDGQLKRMSEDLREVIDHVNATSAAGDASNPVTQISKILSAHMDSLQWLDTNSGALQQKLDQLNKQVTERKVEQESRLRLAFDY